MQIRWDSLCAPHECLHLASVRLTSERRRSAHSHDFYECFLVEAGRGLHAVRGQVDLLEVGQLVFIRPEHAHALSAQRGHEVLFRNFAFAPAVVERMPRRDAFPPGVWAADAAPRMMRLNQAQRQRVHALMSDVGASTRGRLDADFFLLGLLRILQAQPTPPSERDALPEWLREALPVASELDNLRAGLPRLVQLCGRSPAHVSRTFQRCLGLSPSAWLNRERMRQARYLLETSQLSILEVSLECGIESLSYFHRSFKAATGHTPRHYRARAATVQDASG